MAPIYLSKSNGVSPSCFNLDFNEKPVFCQAEIFTGSKGEDEAIIAGGPHECAGGGKPYEVGRMIANDSLAEAERQELAAREDDATRRDGDSGG